MWTQILSHKEEEDLPIQSLLKISALFDVFYYYLFFTRDGNKISKISEEVPKAWGATVSCLVLHLLWWCIKYVCWSLQGRCHVAEVAFHSLNTSKNSALQAGGKSRSPRLCAYSVTMNPLVTLSQQFLDLHVFGVKLGTRPSWQPSTPGCVFGTSLLESALTQLHACFAAQVTRPTLTTSVGKQQQFPQSPLPLKAELCDCTLWAPRTAGKRTSSATEP